MLVLTGVQLNYRHLPTVGPTLGASHAPVRHVSPLRLQHQAEHVQADSLPSDSVVLWRPGHTDTVTPPLPCPVTLTRLADRSGEL
jgi:hypothetical protein